jgi:Uma2 family endonuclease
MATATNLLTIEQFRELYDDKPGYEYWFGKVIRKPMPTWVHGVLQVLLGELLYRAGYFSGSEISLRTDPNWEPRPDLAGALEMEEPYPIRPIDVAIEIPSKNQDPPLAEKCKHYARIGIHQIFTFDPETRIVSEWNHGIGKLEPVEQIRFNNGSVIEAATVWQEFDLRCRKRKD